MSLPLSHRLAAVVLGLGVVIVSGVSCVRQAPPAPAEQRTTAPPWTAPRDAISYIEAAGLEPQPLDTATNQWMVRLTVTVDQKPIEVAPYIGVDRVRAVQAPAHTHDTSGEVWLEGKGTELVTLGDFFTLWGVRMDDRCLGARCGAVEATVDGATVNSDLRDIKLVGKRQIAVRVQR